MGKSISNEQRAKIAITLIWIVLFVDIISLISGYFQYNLLQRFSNGDEISPFIANANDLREQIIGIIHLIVMIISAITFIQWFKQAYHNLHVRVKNLSFTEGWAIGSWFVPIICLYRPYQIMKELYEETKEFLTKRDVIFNMKLSKTSLVIWWTLWLIHNIIGQFVFRYSLRAHSIIELTDLTIASMIGDLVGIPLALITVKVIRDYSKIEVIFSEITNGQLTNDHNV